MVWSLWRAAFWPVALLAVFVVSLVIWIGVLIPAIEGHLDPTVVKRIQDWQAGTGVVFGFAGLVLVETLRVWREAERRKLAEVRKQEVLARGLGWEIDFLKEELDLAKRNVEGLASPASSTVRLTSMAYQRALLPEPVLYPRVVDQIGDFASKDTEGEGASDIIAFYQDYERGRRNVATLLAPFVEEQVSAASIASVSNRFGIAMHKAATARGSIDSYLAGRKTLESPYIN